SVLRPSQVAINLRCTWAKQSAMKAIESIDVSGMNWQNFGFGNGIMPHRLTAGQSQEKRKTRGENGLP
ncbi:MAG: hypothetical protein J4N85_07860, partial [Chloroflexi bacterium]|nr:hypothetical protein [Chloroflexota bacterium]